MRIREISLDLEEMPTKAVVEMSIDEMLFLAELLGKRSPAENDQVIKPDGGRLASSIYSAIVGSVFNRFWDDGVDDALRDR